MITKNYLELMKEKVMSEDHLKQHLKIWRMYGHQIVFTNGCFDILHQGHLSLLCQAKDLGGKLVIGLNSDASIRAIKGEGRPINNQESRSMLLSCLQLVDAVIVFDTETPLSLIQLIEPDVLVKGGDYAMAQIVGAEAVTTKGGRVEIIPILEGFSSTSIIEKMR